MTGPAGGGGPDEAEDAAASFALVQRMMEVSSHALILLGDDATFRQVLGPESLFGYRPGDLTGESAFDYIHPEDAGVVLAGWSSKVQAHGPFYPFPLRVRHRDGSWVRVEVTMHDHVRDPELRGYVLDLRRFEPSDPLDGPLPALAAGEPLPAVLQHCVEALAHAGDRLGAAIFHNMNGRIRPFVADNSQPEIRGTLRDAGDAVLEILGPAPTRERLVLVEIDDLPPSLREAACAVGARSCWCAAISRDRDSASAAVLLVPFEAPLRLALSLRIERILWVAGLAVERADFEKHLVNAATLDSLTGLANRGHLFDVLRQRLDDGPVSVLYVDLDRFKPVNDKFGHRAGDQVLRVVAERLAGALRSGDLAGRLGGDEFAVICPGLSSRDDAEGMAQRIAGVVAQPCALRDATVNVGVSIGVAVGEQHADADELVHAADLALLEVKAPRDDDAPVVRVALAPHRVEGVRDHEEEHP